METIEKSLNNKQAMASLISNAQQQPRQPPPYDFSLFFLHIMINRKNDYNDICARI
jgi:hypothetical protein